MITLFGSGPNFGLPDASPFVTKAETLLRMSQAAVRESADDFLKGAQGQNPLYRR